MRLIRDVTSLPDDLRGPAVALGNFDGVHRGHQAILSACRALAAHDGCVPAVMTFEPHPREFFSPGAAPLRIDSFRRKYSLLAASGIQALMICRFHAQFAALSAEAFIEDILIRRLRVRHVVTGESFAFGSGRRGNVAMLKDVAARGAFSFLAVPPVIGENGLVISSTAIRQALADGNVQAAAAMLGRPYRIGGRVRRGDGRGRELGYPTANLSLNGLFAPRFGVYAARVTLPGGEQAPAAVNIGIRPMFRLEQPLLEAHCLGLSRCLYGERIEVDLLAFLRDEAMFSSPFELADQMAKDCAEAESIYKGITND